MTFWDDNLEDSESISEEFRNEIELETGATPARKEFDVVTNDPRPLSGMSIWILTPRSVTC